MSNLHKDLANDQIHNPKNFDAAAFSTVLTKNASGLLEWVADSGATSGKFVSTHKKGYGNLAGTNTFCQGPPSGNSEHKYTVDLGAAPTTIAPKDAVGGSWYSVTYKEAPTEWVGHIGGATGLSVNLELWRVTWTPCQSTGANMDMCLMATTGDLALTGNNDPLCFNVSTFNAACPTEPNNKDIYLVTARLSGIVSGSFYLDSTIKFTND